MRSALRSTRNYVTNTTHGALNRSRTMERGDERNKSGISFLSELLHHLHRGTDKDSIKQLLIQHHDQLLRTLEREPSADKPGADPKRPSFAALAKDAKAPSWLEKLPADERAQVLTASTLLQMDNTAADSILISFKTHAPNNAQAFEKRAVATPAPHDGATEHALLEPLEAELALLRYAHEQRCLLLRCIHQLLRIAYNFNSELHGMACGKVSLLLAGELPLRLRLVEKVIPSLCSPGKEDLEARLPARLNVKGAHAAVEDARRKWLGEVGALLEMHVERERCEVLGVLVLLHYMPVHHMHHPDSLDPVEINLPDQEDAAREGWPSALHKVIVGKETTTMEPLLEALLPLLAPSPSQLERAPLAVRAGALATRLPTTRSLNHWRLAPPAGLRAWDLTLVAERRAQLATLALMVATLCEKHFCKLHPELMRAGAVGKRHQKVIADLLQKGSTARAVLAEDSAGARALGALLLAWCVVVLEVAPEDERFEEQVDSLAEHGEALHGLQWSFELFEHTRGFRSDDPQEELSDIARLVHFELVKDMLSQERIHAETRALLGAAGSTDALAAPDSIPHRGPSDGWPADRCWPADSENLALLLAAVLEGRPELCQRFANDDSRIFGLLSSRESAHYPAQGRQCRVGFKLQAVLVEWKLPAEQPLDLAPILAAAITALLHAGPTASDSVQSAAAGALELLAHAPELELALEPLVPLADLVSLLPLCASLEQQRKRRLGNEQSPALNSSDRSLLLLTLQLLAALAKHRPQPLAMLLQRTPLLWSDTPWLLECGHARHAAMLLQLLHTLASASMLPSSARSPPPLLDAYDFVVAHLLPARGGGELRWQYERKLRALAMLIALLDDGGGAAAHVTDHLLRSSVAHEGLFDVLRWVSTADPSIGPLQAELHLRQQQWGAAAAFDAADARDAHAMLRVLAGTLGLLARLLQATHGRRSSLHDVLLHPGPSSGVRCLATCMLLHDKMVEIVRDMEETSEEYLSPSLTEVHDVARLEVLLPLCPVDVASIGPLAARCLSLICHAVPAEREDELLRHLSPLNALLSYTLEDWLTSATLLGLKWSNVGSLKPVEGNELNSVGLVAALRQKTEFSGEEFAEFGLDPKLLHRKDFVKVDSTYFRPVAKDDSVGTLYVAALSDETYLEASVVADCASAALQLLVAAAESQHQLFDALCRGGLRPGEKVHVHDACEEPEWGWGLVHKGMIGTVKEVKAGKVTVDFEGHAAWITDRPAELEHCAPRSTAPNAAACVWKPWKELKAAAEKVAAEKAAAEKEAAKAAGDELAKSGQQRPADGAEEHKGPLGPIVQLVGSMAVVRQSCGYTRGLRLIEGLCLQALALISELLRHPAEHSTLLRLLRSSDLFWRSLGASVKFPRTLDEDASSGIRGQTWLCHSLAIDILTQEIAHAVPVANIKDMALAPAAADLLEKTLQWLAPDASSDSSTDKLPSGAKELSSAMIMAATRSQPEVLRHEVQRKHDSLGYAAANLSGGPPASVAMLPNLAVPCVRVHPRLDASWMQDEKELPACALYELWAGGRQRLLSSVALFDIETLQVRAWRLKDAELEFDAEFEAFHGSPDHGRPRDRMVAETALDDDPMPALPGDVDGIWSSGPLEQRQLDQPLEPLVAYQPAVSVHRSTSSRAKEAGDLVRAASQADAAGLASGAHAAMVKSWSGLLTALSRRSQNASPPACASTDEPSTDGVRIYRWLSGVSERKPVESLMESHIRELAKEQGEWLKECSEERQLQHHAEALNAAAELLAQQTLALHPVVAVKKRALPWRLVDQLMQRSTWKQRLEQQLSATRASSGMDGKPVGGHAVRKDQAELAIRVQVLHASLGNGSQPHRSDAGDGLLHELTQYVTKRLTAIKEPTSSPLASKEAQETVEKAIANLNEQNNQLLKNQSVKVSDPVSPGIARIAEELRSLATQVHPSTMLHGSTSVIATAEQEARSARRRLDSDADRGVVSSAGSSAGIAAARARAERIAIDGSSWLGKTGSSLGQGTGNLDLGAAQSLAKVASMPIGDGSECGGTKDKERGGITDKELSEHFKSMDTSGDGLIDVDELKEALAKAGKPTTIEEAKTILDQHDTDGDGKISLEEFKAVFKTSRRLEVRHKHMHFALVQLACARESMAQQAMALRESFTPEEYPQSTPASTDRAALLRWLETAVLSSPAAWNAAQKVHSSLLMQLQRVRARAATAEQSLAAGVAKVIDALVNKRLDDCVAALSECQQHRADAKEPASVLGARLEVSSRLFNLLNSFQGSDVAYQGAAEADQLNSAVQALERAPAEAAEAAAEPTAASSAGTAASAASAASAAVRALLAREESHLAQQRRISTKTKSMAAAEALEKRAAQVQEVMAVLALALHHEQTSPKGAGRSASTLEVCTSGCSFIISLSGGQQKRHLDPHGWFSDTEGRLIERAPQALRALLWPSSMVFTDMVFTDGELFNRALLALVLSLCEGLSSHVLADPSGTRCYQAATLLLASLRFLCRADNCGPGAEVPGRMGGYRCLLDGRDAVIAVKLRDGIAQALLAAFPERVSALSTSLLCSLLQLLGLIRSFDETKEEELGLGRESVCAALDDLVPRLTLSLSSAGVRGGLQGAPLAVRVGILAHLLPATQPINTPMATRGLMDAVLGRSVGLVPSLLPSLLALVATSHLADELLSAGLMSRLLASLPNRVLEGQRYSSGGEPKPEPRARYTMLAIAAGALRNASSQAARGALAQALELIVREHKSLEAPLGDKSLEALREQRAALQLLEQVSRLAGGQLVARMGQPLHELVRQPLQHICEMLMLAPEELERAVPPASKEERALGARLPSGGSLPGRLGPLRALGGVVMARPSDCGSAYWARVATVLQGSLCTVVSALGSPEVQAGLSVDWLFHWLVMQGGQSALLSALRAALRWLCPPHVVALRVPGTMRSIQRSSAIGAARSSLIAAAQTCLHVHSAILLQAADSKLGVLKNDMARATVQVRNAGAPPPASVLSVGCRCWYLDDRTRSRGIATVQPSSSTEKHYGDPMLRTYTIQVAGPSHRDVNTTNGAPQELIVPGRRLVPLEEAEEVAQQQLDTHVSELEQWLAELEGSAQSSKYLLARVEAVMDEVCMHDPATRKAVLIPVAEVYAEVQEAVLRRVSAAKLVTADRAAAKLVSADDYESDDALRR